MWNSVRISQAGGFILIQLSVRVTLIRSVYLEFVGVVAVRVSSLPRVFLWGDCKRSPRRVYASPVGIVSSPNIRWILPQAVNVDSRHVFILLHHFQHFSWSRSSSQEPPYSRTRAALVTSHTSLFRQQALQIQETGLTGVLITSWIWLIIMGIF